MREAELRIDRSEHSGRCHSSRLINVQSLALKCVVADYNFCEGQESGDYFLSNSTQGNYSIKSVSKARSRQER